MIEPPLSEPDDSGHFNWNIIAVSILILTVVLGGLYLLGKSRRDAAEPVRNRFVLALKDGVLIPTKVEGEAESQAVAEQAAAADSRKAVSLQMFSQARVRGEDFPTPSPGYISDWFQLDVFDAAGNPVDLYPNQQPHPHPDTANRLTIGWVGQESIPVLDEDGKQIGTKRGADFRSRFWPSVWNRIEKAQVAARLGVAINGVRGADLVTPTAVTSDLEEQTLDSAVVSLTGQEPTVRSAIPQGTVANIDADFDSNATAAGTQGTTGITVTIGAHTTTTSLRTRGQFRFPIDTLSGFINDVSVQFNVLSAITTRTLRISPYATLGSANPESDTAATKYTNSEPVPTFVTGQNALQSTGSKTIDLGTSADALLQGLLGGQRLSLGFSLDSMTANSSAATIEAIENTGTDPATLIVDYTANSAPDSPSSLGPSNLVDGSFASDSMPGLEFTLSDPDEDEQVRFQLQIDDSSGFGSPVVDYTSALAAQGATGFTVGQASAGGSYAVGSSGQTLADGSYYWRVKAIAASDSASDWAEANSGSIAFKVDTTPPSGPSDLDSPSHTLSTWSTDDTLDVEWTAASDGGGSGLAGYSYIFDTTSDTVPDMSQDIGAVTTIESGDLSEGNSHYFHIRAVDELGNWGSAVHLGPFFIDTAAPSTPGTPVSATPRSILLPNWTWPPSSDAGSGLADPPYTVQWSQDASFMSGVSSSTAAATSFTHSTPLVHGTWYFRVKAVDASGKESAFSANGTTTLKPPGVIIRGGFKIQ